MLTFVQFVWYLVVMVAMSSAYPTGAPEVACATMVPNHPNTTTSGQPPFKIKLSTTTYQPGSQITGSIYSPTQNKFRGFLIQARASSGQNVSAPVGQFVNPVKDTHTVCGQNDKQGLTHNNNTDKTSIDFTWQSPATSAGKVTFVLTVVESYDPSRYWLKITSDEVLDCSIHTTSAGCEGLTDKSKIHKKHGRQGMALRFQKAKEKQSV